MTAAARVGWCPGALRPMDSGDGLILRVKPPGGVLSLDSAAALAAIANRFGSGALDLTGRGNLQLRGVRPETHGPALDALAELGLLDDGPEAEAVRNVVASPLAGLDPVAMSDLRPLAAAIAARLASDTMLHGLPAKWSIVIDDGGVLSLAAVAADLRFTAVDGGLQVGLADDPARAICDNADGADAMARLGRIALDGGPRRMGDVLHDRSATAIFAEAGLALVAPAAARPAPRLADLVGRHPLGDGSRVGVATPFGSLAAADLAHLTAAARHAGARDLRLTPWRVILVPGLDAAGTATIERALDGTGLITDATDRRLRIAACSGAPACHRGTTPVRDHATDLVAHPALFAETASIAIHVSGCVKGCAHPAPAPWTLVGTDGAYDLVRQGRAGDAPVARALSFQEATTWISRAGDEGQV